MFHRIGKAYYILLSMIHKEFKNKKGVKMVKPQDIIIDEDTIITGDEQLADEIAYAAALRAHYTAEKEEAALKAAMDDMFGDPDFEPSIEREGMGW